MGKYTATRTFQRDRKRTTNSLSNTFSGASLYFTEVPKNESQFKTQAFLYSLDPTGLYSGYLDYRDTVNYWSDYMRNTGASWSDIKYPTMMMNYSNLGGGRQVRNLATYVSKNIHRLYY